MNDFEQVVKAYAETYPCSVIGEVVAAGGVAPALALIKHWPGQMVRIPSQQRLVAFFLHAYIEGHMRGLKTCRERRAAADEIARRFGLTRDYVLRIYRKLK